MNEVNLSCIWYNNVHNYDWGCTDGSTWELKLASLHYLGVYIATNFARQLKKFGHVTLKHLRKQKR